VSQNFGIYFLHISKYGSVKITYLVPDYLTIVNWLLTKLSKCLVAVQECSSSPIQRPTTTNTSVNSIYLQFPLRISFHLFLGCRIGRISPSLQYYVACTHICLCCIIQLNICNVSGISVVLILVRSIVIVITDIYYCL
jgi:hypothetical protein